MAFTDNLTADQLADCQLLGIDFDARCTESITNISKDAARQRSEEFIAQLALLPASQQASVLAPALTATQTAQAQVAEPPTPAPAQKLQ